MVFTIHFTLQSVQTFSVEWHLKRGRLLTVHGVILKGFKFNIYSADGGRVSREKWIL